MSVLQFGSNRDAYQQPIISIERRGLGMYDAAVSDAVKSRYTDRA